jgi:hypothetical protein
MSLSAANNGLKLGTLVGTVFPHDFDQADTGRRQ